MIRIQRTMSGNSFGEIAISLNSDYAYFYKGIPGRALKIPQLSRKDISQWITNQDTIKAIATDIGHQMNGLLLPMAMAMARSLSRIAPPTIAVHSTAKTPAETNAN
jgi:hypothetical protein